MRRHRTTGRKLKMTFGWQRFDAERTRQTGDDINNQQLQPAN